MQVITLGAAEDLLSLIQPELDLHEAANSLMLGILEQLVRNPERIQKPPCLMVVQEEAGLVLAAVMTPPKKLVVYGRSGDLKDGTRLLVDDLCHAGLSIPGVLGPEIVAKEFALCWSQQTGRVVQLEQRQRLYALRQVITPSTGSGTLRKAGQADASRIIGWWMGFHQEIFGEVDREEATQAVSLRIGEGDIYLWEDGQPVSMAMKTRPLKKGISVNGVYTPPEFRGKGYATACVAGLSRLLLGAGWEYCALFTDLANPTSNSIYQKIGYRPVCDYEEYIFL
jgi:uncharacterized protein